MKPKRTKIDDPLTRKCESCGAPPGAGCTPVGNDGWPLPLVPRATRLVHAARLEGATDGR